MSKQNLEVGDLVQFDPKYPQYGCVTWTVVRVGQKHKEDEIPIVYLAYATYEGGMRYGGGQPQSSLVYVGRAILMPAGSPVPALAGATP